MGRSRLDGILGSLFNTDYFGKELQDTDWEGDPRFMQGVDKALAGRNSLDFGTALPFRGVPDAKPADGMAFTNMDDLNAASDTAQMLDQDYLLDQTTNLKQPVNMEDLNAASDTAQMLDQDYLLNQATTKSQQEIDQSKPTVTRTTDKLPIANTDTIANMYDRIGDTAKKSNLVVQDLKATVNTANNLPPEEKKGFFEDLFQDRERMLYLALGFNSMRLDPDQGLTKVIESELKDLRKQRTTNKTYEHLKKTRPDLYNLVKDGNMTIKEAVSVLNLDKFSGNVSLPSPRTDYIGKWDPKTNTYSEEIIPGSKTAMEMAERQRKKDMGLISSAGKANRIGDMIDDAVVILEDPDNYATGVTGAIIRDWAGPFAASSEAKNLEAKITAIKANIGFDKLQRMREESPTGGALGQVAVQELVALQATYGSLDLMQDPKEVVKTLGIVKDVYNRNMQVLADTMDTADGYSADVLAKYGIDISAFKGKKDSKKDDPLGIR